MRRTLLIAFLILLTAGVMAMGAPLDDLKRAATSADKKAAASGTELQAIVKSFTQHLATLGEITRQLEQQRDRQKQAGPIIARALEAVNADLAAAKTEATATERALRDAEAAASKARADLGPKRAAVERAASAERKAFEASEDYRSASAKVEAADAALARERARLDATLKSDATIVPLLAAVSKAEADLNAARAKSPADDAAIAEASARWIDAKNNLGSAQATAYAADAAFASAQKASTAAANARTALSDAFDRSILTQPGVGEAQLALRDANNAVKLADAAVEAARDDVARAGRWLISRRASADAIAQIAHDADEGIALAALNVKRAQEAARAISQDLSEAATHVLSIRDDTKSVLDAANAVGKTK